MRGVDRVSRAYRTLVGDEFDEYIAASKAPHTLLSYESAVRIFSKWCEAEGRQALPASIDTLRAYIRHLARAGRAAATINLHIAGIRAWHRLKGQARIDLVPLRDMLRGVRKKAKPPEQAKPLMGEALAAIVASLDTARPGDVRDGALLTLGWASALRGVEACALDWLRPGRKHEGNAGYVRIVSKGIECILTTSKTSQLEPVKIPTAKADMPSAVDWLHRWSELAALHPGEPVFRPVDKGGHISSLRLASAAVTPIVRARVLAHLLANGMSEAEAHLEASGYSGHSLRAGFLSTAALKGAPEWMLRARGRHRSADVAAGYVRLREQWDNSAVKGVGF
jgi:site-specific recombinase XerC